MGKGGRGGCNPPLRVKNKSPPLHQKNGHPSQKILDLFYSIPPVLFLFVCMSLLPIKLSSCHSLQMTEKPFLFSSNKLFFYMLKKFSSTPPSPLFTQAMAAKNITFSKAIFESCTHKTIFSPPLRKKCPCVLTSLTKDDNGKYWKVVPVEQITNLAGTHVRPYRAATKE